MSNLLLHTLFFLLLLPISFCTGAQIPTENLDAQLHNAFISIYLSHYGLNYPSNEKILTAAIHAANFHNDHASLDVFNRVMNAKHFIQDQVRLYPDRVLNITLDHIFKADTMKNITIYDKKDSKELQGDRFAVTGAVIALYLFHTEKQDQLIFERMKSASPKVLDELFGGDYEWQYNRPNPEQWIAFVEETPETILSKQVKKRIVDTFKQTEFKKFGIMLDRPPELNH